MNDFNICFEIYMFKYVKKMLVLYSKIIKRSIPTQHKNKNLRHIYYLVSKFYIFNLGKECKSFLTKKYDYSPLIRDIKNTINYNIDITTLEVLPTISNKVNNILDKFEKKCKYTLKYENNYLIFNSDIGDYKLYLDNKLFNKLKKSYTGSFDIMEIVFVILLRYTLLENKKQSINLSANFIYDNKKITNKIKLDVELFGSPINHNLDKYCSLFYDLEQYFGSIGSVFCVDDKIWSDNTYFVANPPFDESIMEYMANMIINVLDKYEKCCFIIIIPDWRSTENTSYAEIPYTTYDILVQSKYCKIDKVVKIPYYDYFTSKYIEIGKTKTIVLVLSNFEIPFIKDDI